MYGEMTNMKNKQTQRRDYIGKRFDEEGTT